MGEPDEATTSLRAHLPGPCLRNDQPLTVYVAASPLLSLSLPFASLLSASQPPLSRAGCLALLVSLCLSGSARLALSVSLCLFALSFSHSAPLYLSRSASRSICLALPVPLCLFYTVHPALSVPRCLSGSGCPALSVPRCLSGYACLALSVWLCLSRSACLAVPVSLCLSGSACFAVPVSPCLSGSARLALPVWLCLSACLALQRSAVHSPCLLQDHSRWKATCTRRYAPLSLFAHSNTLSAHILSVVSQAALPPRCI